MALAERPQGVGGRRRRLSFSFNAPGLARSPDYGGLGRRP